MKKTIRTLGAVSALALFASASAGAQNNSDAIISGTSIAAIGGNYTPGVGGGGLGANTATVRGEANALSGGTPAQQEVGAVLRSASSAGAVTTLTTELSFGGATAVQARTLVAALVGLAANPSRSALNSAILAYNALIMAMPLGSAGNPPPQIGAIRGALLAIRSASPGSSTSN